MQKMFNYEKRGEPIASSRVFYGRLVRNGVWAAIVVSLSLLVGTVGYMFFENMPAVDGFANASMILSGMGPLTPLYTMGGKLFASLYAIASGLLLFAVAGLILAPIYHRILHRFHVEEGQIDPPPPRARRRKR